MLQRISQCVAFSSTHHAQRHAQSTVRGITTFSRHGRKAYLDSAIIEVELVVQAPGLGVKLRLCVRIGHVLGD